ncbi:MAG: hypothetical protein NC094_10655, partial [Bacteroidales bacterium]|nr:hypothetical protein [Lachnoclostridium sp.]MCM1384978.1 hypothetical protein [Lachnoclostridium sp.]MCM1465866.1 hypothetical protein [Bacteroidales bacterium]
LRGGRKYLKRKGKRMGKWLGTASWRGFRVEGRRKMGKGEGRRKRASLGIQQGSHYCLSSLPLRKN